MAVLQEVRPHLETHTNRYNAISFLLMHCRVSGRNRACGASQLASYVHVIPRIPVRGVSDGPEQQPRMSCDTAYLL